MSQATHTNITRRSILAGLAASIPAAAVAVAPAYADKHPDTGLLALGRQWEAAREGYIAHVDTFNAAEERYLANRPAAQEVLLGFIAVEEENNRLFRAEAVLREKIIAMPARTIEGIILKARVQAWIMDGAENIDTELDEHFERAGLDEVTVLPAIVRDLLRLNRAS